jgi:hypothetical protein
MSFWLISSNIFHVAKNTKSDIKIPGFHQNFQKKKENLFWKKKNVFVHTAKYLQAKKSYGVFHTKKKTMF